MVLPCPIWLPLSESYYTPSFTNYGKAVSLIWKREAVESVWMGIITLEETKWVVTRTQGRNSTLFKHLKKTLFNLCIVESRKQEKDNLGR